MRASLAAVSLGFAAVLTAPAAQAEHVAVLAGNLPPMFMEGGGGREAEVITAVMEHCGHTVSFLIEPFTRHWASYEAGKGDAVATVPPGMTLPGGQTAVYIRYQNGVSTLAANDIGGAGLDGLAGQRVIAFAGAEQVVPELAGQTGRFGSYREIADQIGQSRMIFGHRVDAVIGDGMIFAEYNRSLREDPSALMFDPNQPVVFRAIFEPSSYVMNFRDPAIAADFDRCFAELDAAGAVGAINRKWAERYRDTLGDQYMGY